MLATQPKEHRKKWEANYLKKDNNHCKKYLPSLISKSLIITYLYKSITSLKEKNDIIVNVPTRIITTVVKSLNLNDCPFLRHPLVF